MLNFSITSIEKENDVFINAIKAAQDIRHAVYLKTDSDYDATYYVASDAYKASHDKDKYDIFSNTVKVAQDTMITAYHKADDEYIVAYNVASDAHKCANDVHKARINMYTSFAVSDILAGERKRIITSPACYDA